jgi:large subunit ribosomal protein L7/L12
MAGDNVELEAELRELLGRGQKIEAIKRYRAATGAGLAVAKKAVEDIEQGAGLSLPQPLPEGWESEVVTLLQGGKKIDAIKLYREKTGLGLKEAKDAVEAIAGRMGLPASRGCLGVVLFLAAALGAAWKLLG